LKIYGINTATQPLVHRFLNWSAWADRSQGTSAYESQQVTNFKNNRNEEKTSRTEAAGEENLISDTDEDADGLVERDW